MLDLIKVSVVLTVQVGLRVARPSLSEGLPAPLVFEWGVGVFRRLSVSIKIDRESRPRFPFGNVVRLG